MLSAKPWQKGKSMPVIDAIDFRTTLSQSIHPRVKAKNLTTLVFLSGLLHDIRSWVGFQSESDLFA